MTHWQFGIHAGFGFTSWPNMATNDDMAQLSLPVAARENKFITGIDLSWQASNRLSISLNYLHFPNSQVRMDPVNIYSQDVCFVTHSSTVGLVTRLYIPITPNHTVKAYLSAGPAVIIRHDHLASMTHIVPDFGMGVTVQPSKHIVTGLAFNYYSGYAKADSRPLRYFVPFLYALTYRLAYQW